MSIRLSVGAPRTKVEKEAVEMWRRATPYQRLRLIVEARRLGLLVSGRVKPWEVEDFIKDEAEGHSI